MEQRRAFKIATAIVIAVLMIPYPGVLAQPIEVDRSVTSDVAASVERLVAETAARDPELASLIEREGQTCLLDLDDGVLEDPQLTEAVEAVAVANEAREQVVANVAAEQLASEVSKVDPQLAAQLEAPQGAGGEAGAGGEMINREQAKQVFEKAYEMALTKDPEGAQHMKEMFDAFEKGEFHEIVRPTPEMMERMQGEMERYFSERGQGDNEYVRECAIREMERLGAEGREQFEREMGEHRAEFDVLMAEGRSPDEIAKIMGHEMPEGPWRDMPEGPWREMPEGPWRDMPEGGPERWVEGHDAADIEHYREMMEREVYYDQRLENQQQQNIERTAFEPHAGHMIDHDNDLGTPAIEHAHEIHYHADGSRHDHTGP